MTQNSTTPTQTPGAKLPEGTPVGGKQSPEPIIPASANPADLLKNLALQTPAPVPGTAESVVDGKSYQFPSAPTSFEFASGRRIAIPDGVFTTSDPEEIKELEKCVRAGIIYPYNGEIYSPFAKPAAPLNPAVTN